VIESRARALSAHAIAPHVGPNPSGPPDARSVPGPGEELA